MESTQNFVWDDRAPSYRRVGDMVTHMAEDHCGVNVDITTKERWRDLVSVLREFDTLYDDSDISREDALDELRHFKKLERLYPSLATDQLPDESREKLVRRVTTILDLGEQAARATTVKDFMCSRTQEARQSARLVDDAATEYVAAQPAYEQKLAPALASMSLVACAFDSMLDAKKDYAQGNAQIEPSREYYKACMQVMLHEGRQGMPAMLHRSIGRQLGYMGIDRVRNRIENGITDGSSLVALRYFWQKSS